MSLGLFLIPAIAGYWFLTHWNHTRFIAARDTGNHLFFKSGFYGVTLFALAELILQGLRRYFQEAQQWWDSLSFEAFTDTAALSVVLGVFMPLVLNLVWRSQNAARRAAEANGDGIELLIADSYRNNQLVEVSIKTGKCYIGVPTEPPIAAQGESDVSLILFASGYRSKETQELTITTHYSPVLERVRTALDRQLEAASQAADLAEREIVSVLKDRDSSNDQLDDAVEQLDIADSELRLTLDAIHALEHDFNIVIALSEIVSARIFVPQIFQYFQEIADTGTQQSSGVSA